MYGCWTCALVYEASGGRFSWHLMTQNDKVLSVAETLKLVYCFRLYDIVFFLFAKKDTAVKPFLK